MGVLFMFVVATTRGGTAAAAPAQQLVRNASFEADGTEIKGVGYVRQGNKITGWESTGEGERARNPMGGPFLDNGVVPDGEVIAVLQNRGILRQEVGPFVRDQVYRLTIHATGRASDAVAYGRYGQLEVRLNNTQLLGPLEVKPVEAAGRHATPFHRLEALFYTGGGKLPLELLQVDPADGISVLLDDVRVEPVDTPADQAIRVNRARARLASQPVTQADFRQTKWIWSPEEANPREAAPAGTRFLRRTFDVANPATVTRAFLVAAADNRAKLFVNGEFCGTADGFSRWYETDFTECLRPGRNVLAVEAWNAGDAPNPAGFACMALLLDADGKPLQVLPTDASWKSSRTESEGWSQPAFADADWEPASLVGEVGCPPWGNFGFLTWLVPDDFPTFEVPGHEEHMELLRQLFWLHYSGSGPKATLWDGWLSLCSLWPAAQDSPNYPAFRQAWRNALLGRRLDHEGYVSTHQHHGFGHGEGWPFPTCFQAGGVGWQFATKHLAYRVGPVRDVSGWGQEGLETLSLDEADGWSIHVTADAASLVTPTFDIDSFVAPFVRLEWHSEFPDSAAATLEWTTTDAPDFSPARSLPLRLEPDCPSGSFTHVPLYRHAEWKGRLTRLRLSFRNARGATFRLRGLCAVPDTRHPLNNPCFLQGSTEYFAWTGDVDFLKQNLSRMRTALAYALDEFDVEENGCVLVPWVGHQGRAGWTREPDGKKTVHHGRGVGANYWDLLPFSGKDCLATLYLYDALRRMAELERALAGHPDWQLPAPSAELKSQRLKEIADALRKRAQQLFWNEDTGRFVACIDADGVAHDYGYTFVNCEAVYYGLASPEQARSIIAWLDGQRTVEGDTAVGDDIYHFRFGPRASTRRNTEWYSFVWQNPEGIPWGGQVQDGGAVLGFAFHDQMARLMTAGPDNAWKALRRTLDWFADVRSEGGYRPYYSVAGRGTLQGGGTAGGLGMDCEFFESALLPQVMLYGFLGFRAGPDGFHLDPRLPSDWSELRVRGVHFRDVALDLTVTNDTAKIVSRGGAELLVRLTLPVGWSAKGCDTHSVSTASGPRMAAEVVLGGDRTIEVARGQ